MMSEETRAPRCKHSNACMVHPTCLAHPSARGIDNLTPTATTKPPRMTVAEIGLMREITLWRRRTDLGYYKRSWKEHGRFIPTEWDDTKRRYASGAEVVVEFQQGDDGIRAQVGYHRGDQRSFEHWIPVASVTEAVDILVALGFLPPRFSSAYRAGWRRCARLARAAAHVADPDDATDWQRGYRAASARVVASVSQDPGDVE